MRFKPGQQVVCVYGGVWDDECNAQTKYSHPKKDEICTVVQIEKPPYPHTCIYISIVGYHAMFREDLFEPLMDISELTEILNAQPAEI